MFLPLYCFHAAFRFPLKLAISGVVSFITLYQVTTTATIKRNNPCIFHKC